MNDNNFQIFTAPLFVVDLSSTKIRNWNPSFLDLIGLENAPSSDIYFSDILSFRNIEGWDVFVNEYFIDGGKYFIQITSPNSDRLNYLFQATSLEDRSGESILFQLINSADYRLQFVKTPNRNKEGESETEYSVNVADNLFFKLFQLSPLWMLLYSFEEGRIIDVNESCIDGLGYSYDYLVGKSLYEVNIHPNPMEVITIREEAMKHQRVFRPNFMLKDADGNLKQGILFGELVKMSKGRFFLATFQDMTHFIQMQEKLNESEQKFSLAFKLNPSWMGICRMSDGVFIEVNDRFLRGVGLSEDEVIGRSIFSLKLITDPAGFRQIISSLKDKGNVTKDIFEINTRLRGLRKGFLSVSKVLINNENHLIINFDDRTVFIKLQEMLTDSEERYRGMFDNALAGFYRVSYSEGKIIECNNFFAELIGFCSADKVKGFPVKELVINKKTHSEFLSKLKDESTAIFEMPVRRTDGREIWVANYARRLPSKDYYDGIIVDITERKKIVEILALNENRFRKLISNSSDIIFIVDTQGNCKYISPSISNVLGFSSRARIRNIRNVVSDLDQVKFVDFLNLVGSNGLGYSSTDIQFKHKNGVYRVLSLKASNFTDTPEIGGVLINAHDITEKIKAQEEIALALKKEQELHRQKNHFISTVSHDFRTPLTNISLNIQLLERNLVDNHFINATKNLVRLNNAAKRLTALINEVSLVSKEQSGRLRFTPEEYNSNILIDSIIEQIDYLFQPFVQVEVLKGIPRAVMADRGLLVHIIDNVLNNAIKFSPNQGIVKFSMKLEPKRLKVVVRDNGIGIPQDEVRFLFDPYFRASNISNISGSGLGLSIVKRCVDLHNGEISIKSNEGKGTTVTILVPL